MRTPSLFTLMVAAALILAAGCGGTPGPIGDKADIVTRAPDTTLAAGSARVVIAGPNAGATGVVNLGTGDADLTVTVAPGYESATLRSGELRSVGGVVYFLPAAVRGQPPAAWQRLPAGTPPGLASTGLRFGDPLADIDLIRGTQNILSDGGAEVRGASTARYTLDVDPSQAVQATPPARQPGLKALLGTRTDLFQIDVWIDGLRRVRRVQVPIDLTHHTPETRPDFMAIADTIDFASFAPPVVIAAPI